MKKQIHQLDKNLLSAMVEPITVWYEQCQKPLPWREGKNPYYIWLSEVMLQQTRTTAVIPYYHRFIAALPTVGDLASVEDDALMKLWEGLGYYSRARNLKAAAQRIVEAHGGVLPADFRALRALPGIGDYTAGAISSIAFGLPEPAVDGNVLRVIMRLAADDRDIALADTKKQVTDALREIYPAGPKASALTEAIMELGETICIPNGMPRCVECPLAGICRGLAENRMTELPKKSPKKARRIEERTIFLIEHEGRVGLRKRPAKGLLANLWEFPGADGHLSPDEAMAYAASQGWSVRELVPCGKAVHIFTHVEWHMKGYRLTVDTPPHDLVMAQGEELENHYAIPKALVFFRNLIV